MSQSVRTQKSARQELDESVPGKALQADRTEKSSMSDCVCLQCNKEFFRTPRAKGTAKFCSPKCSTAYRNANRGGPTCSMESCNAPRYGHGYCAKHYTRWRKHGNPSTTLMRFPPIRGRSLADRFWEKVDFGRDCWEWQGALDGHGYGQMTIEGKRRLAHRIAYELEYGPIPKGVLAIHSCDNPLCVRPSHIRLGTHKDNSIDMAAKGRWRNQYSKDAP